MPPIKYYYIHSTILIKSVYLLSLELQALFWKCSFGHLVNMLFDKVVYIAVLGTLPPPEYDASGFAAPNDTTGSSVTRHAVTGPIFDFYNNYWNVKFKQLF